MSNRLMYRLQFRKFDDYSSMVTNHTVNTGNGVAGIRWYEFRDDSSGWQTRIASFNLNEPLVLEVSANEDTICRNHSTQLHADPQGGGNTYTYSWTSDPPGFNSSLQNPIVSPDTNTMYFCEVDDGVNAITDSVKVFVDPCTGLMTSENQPFVALSPNQSGKILQLNFGNLPGNEVRFVIINNSGQILYSKTFKNPGKGQHIISIDRIPAGIYIAVIRNRHYEKNIKLVVM